MALSRSGKDCDLVDLRRRKFLVQCCQGASAALFPPTLFRVSSSSFPAVGSEGASATAEFRLHPHYRSAASLDSTLLKTRAGFDDFIAEEYCDQIEDILRRWTSGLLESPRGLQAIADVLTESFRGFSLSPMESRVVRSSGMLEVHQNRFSAQTALGRGGFLSELEASFAVFSKFLTADFQITRIDATSMSETTPANRRLRTRILYELVGTGPKFHREQRVGFWELEWEPSPSGKFFLRSWQGSEESQSRAPSPFFVDITEQALGSNSSYTTQLLRDTDYWRTILDGACGIDIYGHNGVAVGDVDNDGFEDLYVCQPAGLPNRLYRNRGDGTFADITEASGVGVLENTACALLVDVDNDGRQDLIVVRANGPLLFLNEGGGKFRQKPNAFQFQNPPQGTFTGTAAADYDRDGWLDIYFCLYSYYQGAGQYKYPAPYYAAENGPPNFLMRNNRDGTFRDVTRESGLEQNNTRYSFCCGWSDFTHDGWPDLYVVNDFGRKNLYRNNGDGTFTDTASQAGVEDVGAGMSVCWFDYDNDGREDIYVGNMWTAAGERITAQNIFKHDSSPEIRDFYRKHAMGNSLFCNREGRFQDATVSAGVGRGRWSWSSDAWDFDHDGFSDLYVVNGMISGPSREDLNSFFWRQVVANSPDGPDASVEYEQGWSAINELIRSDGTWSGFERNVFYLNNRDGSFSDISGVIGLDFREDGRSFVLADFDHDGRQEVALKNRNGPQLQLLKNVADGLPPSIIFHLQGKQSNRDAIGAAVTIETATGHQTRLLQAGSGFLSQHSKELLFGLGEAKGPIQASIRWPSGIVQTLRDLPPSHRIWVTEGMESPRIEPFSASAAIKSQAGSAEAPRIEGLPTRIETWLLAPVQAPEFSLPDLTGQVGTLSSFRGKPVLFYLWTVKSQDCVADLAGLEQRHTSWASRGVRIVTMNCDEESDRESARTLIGKRHFSFPILVGSDDVLGIYNILFRSLFDRRRDLGLPTLFLISDEGNIVKVYQGSLDVELVEQDFTKIPRTNVERLARGLPFPGVTDTMEFGRNYLSLGSMFFQRGYMEQAAAAFQTASRDDPSSAEALYGLGSVYLNQQRITEAKECFTQATKLPAGYPRTLPDAWNNLGLIAAQAGRTQEAIDAFQQALQLSPAHLVALNNLGNAYRQQRAWDLARATFERALALRPRDAEANYGLGMVFAQANNTDRAYEFLQRALKSRPDYPEALNNLGILYLRTQHRDDAVASFEKCIQVAPAFDQAYLNLARVYALENASQKARTVLLELLKKRPDDKQAQQALAELPE